MIQDERGLWGITGGPTEGALKVLAAKAQLRPSMPAWWRRYRSTRSISTWRPTRKMGDVEQSADYQRAGRDFCPVPPAVEQAGAVPFEPQYWEEEMARFARQGLRMVAAAYKPANVGSTTLTHDDLREGLVFLGIAGMMDPPRPEAIDAIPPARTRGSREDDYRRPPPADGDERGQMPG